MKSIFEVKVLSFKNLLEIENAWDSKSYLDLMEVLDYSDIENMSESDIKETCLMLLQDLKPEAAAYCLLKYRLGSSLKEGQLRNLAVEMQDDKLWEEYADPGLHEQFFCVGCLLYSTFPKVFPKPDAVQLTFEMVPKNVVSKVNLSNKLNESLVLRVLADGMSGNDVLIRLYGDQLKIQPFAEAENILWTLKVIKTIESKVVAEVTSSGYWLDSLIGVDAFESSFLLENDSLLGQK